MKPPYQYPPSLQQYRERPTSFVNHVFDRPSLFARPSALISPRMQTPRLSLGGNNRLSGRFMYQGGILGVNHSQSLLPKHSLTQIFQNVGTHMPDYERAKLADNLEKFLRHLPLFNGIHDKEIPKIAAAAKQKVYPRVTAVFHQGDIGNAFF